MGQRLGIAAALLGDPSTVILDEPANGLDPEGILWIRNLLKSLAAEGKTVFLSSHLMSEMAQTAEHLIVIGRGRLIADTTVAEIVEQASRDTMVVVHAEHVESLARALRAGGATVDARADRGLEVRGLRGAEIGAIALREQIVVHELTPQRASLEQAFMHLTGSSVEFRTGAAPGTDPDDLARAA
jgi:ABC-2 type transport system ATP-binding protein